MLKLSPLFHISPPLHQRVRQFLHRSVNPAMQRSLPCYGEYEVASRPRFGAATSVSDAGAADCRTRKVPTSWSYAILYTTRVIFHSWAWAGVE